MNIIPYSDDLNLYLLKSDIIDFDDNEIIEISEKIESSSDNDIKYIKNAFEYVRDNISHSADINNDVLTCKASEVLHEGHGICFAKSHLLAALLRCKSIPCGFCYQKLVLDDKNPNVLVFHGLNGVYLKEYRKWIRLDARGNKNGINSQFSIEKECLAYNMSVENGEKDIPFVFPDPDVNVVNALVMNKTRSELWKSLPRTLAYKF